MIDCFPASVARYRDDHVIVAIDVIRATTLAATAVETGRDCFVAGSVSAAFVLRDQLGDALLAGELGGDIPDGFDMNNSPADLALRTDIQRPLVMLSTSGTELMLEASKSPHGAYLACFRNHEAVARHLATLGKNVAVIGAGSRNEFREEDQMCCAWVAGALIQLGFCSANPATAEISRRWFGAPAPACATSNSVGYLLRSGQMRDFDFIVSHVNDMSTVVQITGNEVSKTGNDRQAIISNAVEAA
jgi:2-phosphosulfolactate phosphatase